MTDLHEAPDATIEFRPDGAPVDPAGTDLIVYDDDPPPAEIPPLSPKLALARGIFLMIFVVCASLLFHVMILSHFQQEASQQRAFSSLRGSLATGTAPTGPLGFDGEQIEIGTPIARMEIDAIGLDQVVVYGTGADELMIGPGHRRDTVFPGQAGTSIVMARRGSYGGPFAAIDSLDASASILITTAQGQYEYQVVGVRREGDPLPGPLPDSGARLTLVTADGPRYVPSGLVQVDADLVGVAAVGQTPAHTIRTLPASEKPLGNDTSTLWALALWIQLATLLSMGALWVGARWGRPQAWLVFTPPLLLVGISVSSELVRVLPNLF